MVGHTASYRGSLEEPIIHSSLVLKRVFIVFPMQPLTLTYPKPKPRLARKNLEALNLNFWTVHTHSQTSFPGEGETFLEDPEP